MNRRLTFAIRHNINKVYTGIVTTRDTIRYLLPYAYFDIAVRVIVNCNRMQIQRGQIRTVVIPVNDLQLRDMIVVLTVHHNIHIIISRYIIHTKQCRHIRARTMTFAEDRTTVVSTIRRYHSHHITAGVDSRLVRISRS